MSSFGGKGASIRTGAVSLYRRGAEGEFVEKERGGWAVSEEEEQRVSSWKKNAEGR